MRPTMLFAHLLSVRLALVLLIHGVYPPERVARLAGGALEATENALEVLAHLYPDEVPDAPPLPVETVRVGLARGGVELHALGGWPQNIGR